MHEVTTPQIVLLLLAAALLVAGAAFSLLRGRWEPLAPALDPSARASVRLPLTPEPAGGDEGGLPRDPVRPSALPARQEMQREPASVLRVAAKACFYSGLLLAVAVLVWHAAGRGSWFPLEDNFDALVWLGVLLALFVLYTQRKHPLRGLDWFVMPIVVLLLVAAAVFGRAKPHEYIDTTWSLVHRLTAYGGAAAFAIACASGIMFLIVRQRLRKKSAVQVGRRPPALGSLERLEHLMLTSVTVGFALLTIGAVTGLVKIAEAHGAGGTRLGAHWFLNPKVLLSAGAWSVYAVVLHSPINPSFRGRRAALLSVVGFALMIGILVAVQFMPASPAAPEARNPKLEIRN